MSTSTKDKAFKVLAYDEKDKLIAEYLFAKLKEAIKFQLGMQKKGYTTTMQRLYLNDWTIFNSINLSRNTIMVCQ